MKTLCLFKDRAGFVCPVLFDKKYIGPDGPGEWGNGNNRKTRYHCLTEEFKSNLIDIDKIIHKDLSYLILNKNSDHESIRCLIEVILKNYNNLKIRFKKTNIAWVGTFTKPAWYDL